MIVEAEPRTYEISQVNMSLRVKKHIVWLKIPVHDSLGVDVS